MDVDGSARNWRWYGWALTVLVVVYLGWVGLSRYLADRAAERSLKTKRATSASPVPAARSEVKILHFYAGNGVVVRGEHTVVCYGVENAKAVRIKPPVEEITPSPNRCIAASPTADTTYTLYATGHDGTDASVSFTVRVTPAPPRILFIEINKTSLRRGEPLAICYGVENAASVVIGPMGWRLPPSPKHCVMYRPGATLRYTVTARSAEGRTDRESFTVKVH